MIRAAFVLAGLFSTAALAQDYKFRTVDFKGCTADGKTATFSVMLDDAFIARNPDFEKKVQKAVSETTRILPARNLLTEEAVIAFDRHFTADEINAIMKVSPKTGKAACDPGPAPRRE